MCVVTLLTHSYLEVESFTKNGDKFGWVIHPSFSSPEFCTIQYMHVVF